MSSDLIQISVPSIDRPFGIYLWPIFEFIFDTFAGFKPQDFRFIPGETPLSSLKSTTSALATYYVIVFGGREIMKNRQAIKLNTMFKIHNFYLTFISGSLLALFVEQLLPTLYRHGIFFTICQHKGGWTNELVILYYVCIPLVQPRVRY